MSFHVRVGAPVIIALLLVGTAAGAATVSGKVYRYPIPGTSTKTAAGVPVTIQALNAASNWQTECKGNQILICEECNYCNETSVGSSVTVVTDAAGNYTATAPVPNACTPTPFHSKYQCGETYSGTTACETQYFCGGATQTGKIQIYADGPEDSIGTFSYSSSKTYAYDITSYPNVVSPNRTAFARQMSTGTTPIVLVEGYDPIDANKTSAAYCPAGSTCDNTILGLVQGSPIGPGKNLYDYLVSKGYAVYFVTLGQNGGMSMRGSPLTAHTSGAAFQAMRVIKEISDAHAGQKVAVGGYSAGGVLVQAGLARWCGGAWAANGLPKGCDPVAMWFAGDAPLKGAIGPVALQRYIKDEAISSEMTSMAGLTQMVDSPMARELLVQKIEGACDTDCAGGFLGNEGWEGCNSYQEDFDDWCDIHTEYLTSFQEWKDAYGDGGFPTRYGVVLPALGFSVGDHPDDPSPCPATWPRVLETITDVGDHNLYMNSAGGTNECKPGSVLNSLHKIDGTTGKAGPFDSVSFTIDVKFFPTFIPTTSALAWADGAADDDWADYWHNTTNAHHFDPLPLGASRVLLAYVSEHLRGGGTQPVCGHPFKKLGFKPGATCRTAVVEIAGNGKDDDGDDLVDETSVATVDGYCSPGETCSNNPSDCGSCPLPPAVCGNGSCEGYGGESCCNCAADCGAFSCFGAGTSVTMADGSHQDIELVEVGDRVLAYDEETGETVTSTVTATMAHPNLGAILVVNGTIETTANHPFWVNGRWVPAGELAPGDRLVRLAAPLVDARSVLPFETIEVMSLETRPGRQTVYNLEVAEQHTYFAADVLVHNKLACTPDACAPLM